MGVIVKFPAATVVDMDPEKVLDAAREQLFDDVFVFGSTRSGPLYLSGSTADLGRFLIYVEQLKRQMIPDAPST